MSKIIIGVTGLTGSGKDTVSEYLEEKGFVHSSLSDQIREECKKRGLSTDRDNLIMVGNELREKFGYEEVAKRSLEMIEKSDSDKYVLSSVRHPKEVEFLQGGGMKLVAVTVPIEVRYERNSRRGRIEDGVTFEKFQEQEERERAGSANQQQIDAVIEMADYRIDNSGTMEELKAQIEEVVKKIEG